MSALIPYVLQLLSVDGLLCNERTRLSLSGPSLIQQLLDDFLFRASRIIINSSNPTPSPAASHDFHPKYDHCRPHQLLPGCLFIAFKANRLLCIYPGGCRCNTASSRLAAYEVLLMLGDSSLSNLRLITRELLFMHHQSDPSLCKEFDVRCTTKCRLTPSCFTCETKLLLLSLSSASIYPLWRAGQPQGLWV